jgi:hypothetical protein
MLSLLVVACGGGGGTAPSSSSQPPPLPPASTAPGPTAPEIALARPISPLLLCGNGLAKRHAAASADQFVAAGAELGIDHSHAVDMDVWMQEPASIESVMRTGAVVTTHANGDCWPDLIFTTGAIASGQLIYYENRAGRSFSQTLLNVTPTSNPIAAVGMADLDGDYRLDLALGNLLAGDAEIYRGRADGGFELHQVISMPRSTFGFAFGDYSGDGWLDAYAAHWDIAPEPTDAPALLRNTAGTLVGADSAAGTTSAAVSQEFSLAPGFIDLDGDGLIDLLIAADFGTSQVLLNTGAQSYTAVTDSIPLSDENASGHAIRDFDNDGRWDWFVASVHAPADGRVWPWGIEGNRLYWGDGQFPFLSAADSGTGVEDAEWPWGICAEDFNNNGLVDLFVENGFGLVPDAVMASQSSHPFVQQINESLFDKKLLRPRLFINQGDRTFVDRSYEWGITELTNGRGVACFDYDRDGDIDIVVAQNSGPALLWENRHSAADGNSFVSLRLVSIAPNTYAVGAVVTVEAGGLTQMRQVSANNNFLGQDATDLHFGLGSATNIDRITVQWPRGETEIYSDLPPNRFLTLLDPRMLPYADPERLRRVDAAIASALRFVASPTELAEDLLLGLSWMERMHGLSLAYSPGAELNVRASRYQQEGRTREASQLRAWRRSYDPAYRISVADYDRLAGFDAVTFAGVYCHQFPLDDGYVQSLTDLASLGGYSTTHVLLALLWAIDNNCVMPRTYDPQLLSSVVSDVYAIADDTGSHEVTDLRVEAMALLAAVGRDDLIQPSWVDQVLDAQLASGAWKGRPEDQAASNHTTGLALWLSLQLAEQTKVLSGFVAQLWDGI